MRHFALVLVLLILGNTTAHSQKFKVGKIVDPVSDSIRYTSEIIPIGYNHKDHYVGKMYLQAAVFIQNSQYHLSLILDYPTFRSFESGTIVSLYLSGGSEIQLTVDSSYLSRSKHGSERWRQPEQVFYSYLELPLTAEQVAQLEQTRILKIKYDYSTYQVDEQSQRILRKMIKRVRKFSGNK